MSILEKIIETKKSEVAKLKEIGEARLTQLASASTAPRGFLDRLRSPGMQVIAEVKQASPSAGILRSPFDPAEIAKSYAQAGAACLSVLTDQVYFKGSLEHLKRARAVVDIPVLRKDFIIDPLQVYEARAAGADAILLIAEILESRLLAELFGLAQSLGMDVLVEVHDCSSVAKAVAMNAPLIGINNRDLRIFTTNLEHSLKVKPSLPKGSLVVSESGIKDPSDIARLEAGGIKAVLVGETFMRAENPGSKLMWLMGFSKS